MSTDPQKVFCPIPWLFQAVRNNGDLRICCQANVSKNRGILRDEDGKAYNVREGRLIEARNAPMIKRVRKNMLRGEWSSECVRCFEEEKAGLNSRRHYELQNWKMRVGDVAGLTAEDGSINPEDSPIMYYDIRFGNRCNLACRMCGPSDSDTWYSDFVQLSGSPFYNDSHGKVSLEKKGERWVDPDKSYNWYESDLFWEDLNKIKGGLRHIYMAGGEPLLIREHYKFLERCHAEGAAQNIILEYNTNMTIFPDHVVELWKGFNQVRVGASIDGFGDVFEFQRYPGRWNVAYSNLKKLDSLEAPVFSWLAYTVTLYNVLHLPEFMKWKVEESGFVRINSSKRRPVITHHVAHKPEHLNVRNLTKKQKERVQARFREYRTYFAKAWGPHLADHANSILDGVEKYMMGADYTQEYALELHRFNEKLDAIRGQSSAHFMP